MGTWGRRGVLFLAAALLVLAAGPLRAGDPPREECSLCGMWLDEYPRTRHVVALKSGGSLAFCSLSCAGVFLEQKGDEVASVRAADYGTAALVDARTARYVLGSDAPPVMGATSTVAFGREADAAAFQKEHGGALATFEQALEANRR